MTNKEALAIDRAKVKGFVALTLAYSEETIYVNVRTIATVRKKENGNLKF